MFAFLNLSKKKLGQKLLLLLGSTMLTLLVLELVFRIAGIRGDYHQPRVDRVFPIAGMKVEPTAFGFYSNSIIVSQYDSNPRMYFEPGNTIAHRHNSIGWRDVEHTLDKPVGVFRILGLGDSYLWGQGVKREDICLTKLADHLRESGPEAIETINAGLTAFNTENQRDQLIAKGLAFDPDLVIVHYVLNDVEQDLFRNAPKIDFFRDYTSIYQSTDRLSNFSYLWSWSRYRILKHLQANRYIQDCAESFRPDSTGWRASRNALYDIKVICDQNDIRLCVVIFPFFYDLNGDYPFQPIHTTVAEFCQSQEIHVLDLRDHFRDFEGPELWVHATDQHPNEIAHDIAAREIARFLKGHVAEMLVGSKDESD